MHRLPARRFPAPLTSRANGLRSILFATVAVALLGSAPAASLDSRTRRMVVVTPTDADTRLAETRDAVSYWNGVFAELRLPQPLGEAEVLAAPPFSRALEMYARSLSRLAGRPMPPAGHPEPPEALAGLDADIVVFFSAQRIFSFAWPLPGGSRYVLGISIATYPPLAYPNVTRNVIAHELGHALGLRHNGNTPTLMCGPCERLLYRSDSPMFFPLTDKERARLVQLHQAQ